MKDEFKCFFCGNPATLLGYYSKLYPSGMDTIETPTFFCSTCWQDDSKRNEINAMRGGIEGVYCLLFSTIGKMDIRTLSICYLSRKNKEINHLANQIWL
jgi:hypothetical protein